MHQKIIHLVEQKEAIKNLVTDPSLKWQERMSLYTKVRLINERIQQLQTIGQNK